MNKMIFFLLLAVSLSAAEVIFTINTERDGSSSVILSMDSGEMVETILPTDATNFRIVGGSFEMTNQSAYVTTGKTGIATFSYSSSSLTSKTSTGWRLSFLPPTGSTVIILMPAYSTIENSDPTPRRISSDDSRITIELDYANVVTVNYRLEEIPQAEQQGYDSTYILIAVILITAIGIIVFQFFRPWKIFDEVKKERIIEKTLEKQPTLELTTGKRQMIETFNENDLKIVNLLLSSEGKARRNDLERKTGISKSSLAMALNRLEKRKIVEIDRTATTHFVRLSEYFLRL